MGSFRQETYYAGAYMIAQLKRYNVMAQMRHDGGDIILFDNRAGQRISVHLIESAFPLYEIRNTLQYNAQRDTYTLFILWCSMMLPEHQQRYVPEDWMTALYALHGDHIYAYDMFGGETFLFPVYFRGEGVSRLIEYGSTVPFASLEGKRVTTRLPGFVDEWMVAEFIAAERSQVMLTPELRTAYAVLGVEPGEDSETLKRAYRLLARRYHPDTNSAPDAHEQMQRINEAYAQILQALA